MDTYVFRKKELEEEMLYQDSDSESDYEEKIQMVSMAAENNNDSPISSQKQHDEDQEAIRIE